MAGLPAKKTVELFYDVVSPYSWVAFEVLCRYRSKWNIDLKFKPFFLGGVMQATGNKPPAMVPAKGAYMTRDIENIKQYYQIPFNQPANVAEVLFVKGSLAAQRFVTAVDIKRPELTEAITRELWMRIWSRDEDITTPESLMAAGKKVGLTETQVNELIASSKEGPVKDRLKAYTQEALDLGVFGAPTMVYSDKNNKKQFLFGSDRVHILAMHLGEKYDGPLTELAQSKL